jgi:sigma-E factor negative regulatory protein RseB
VAYPWQVMALRLALLFVASLACVGVAAEDSAHDWLVRMLDATRHLSYDGTFVYRTGTRVETMRIVHRYAADGERERLIALDGAAREVIRTNDEVMCILPDDAVILVGKRLVQGFQMNPVFNLTQVPVQYQLSLGGQGRVAGRVAVNLRLSPQDSMRYGYRLSLDQATGLLLRAALLGANEQVLEEIAYTNLTVPADISDQQLQPSVSGEGFTRYETGPDVGARAVPDEVRWLIAWRPDGFELREYLDGASARDDLSVEHFVYSDGLASLSVFIEQLPATEEPMTGHAQMGAVNAFGRMLEGHQVTVVGEVPAGTVERVALSVTMR